MSDQFEYPLVEAGQGTFSSLTVPTFRRYLSTYFISMIGAWMQMVAISWLVWRLTASGTWMGLVNFSGGILTFLFGPFGGAYADRFDRKKLLLITQAFAFVEAILLWILTATEIITPTIILILSLTLGAILALDFPARMTLINDMVGKKNLGNAIAIGSSVFHAARVIGPAVAGLVVAKWGEANCFLVNGLAYLPIILFLMFLSDKNLIPQEKDKTPVLRSIKEGVRVIGAERDLKIPLVILLIACFLCMPYYILIPIFVSNIYLGTSTHYGTMMAASAIGAVTSAIFVARTKSNKGLKLNIAIAICSMPLALIGFAWTKNFFMALAIIYVAGFFMLMLFASINTLLQKTAPDHARGRVLSVYSMIFVGAMPLGSLIFGFAAERFSAPITITTGSTIAFFLGIPWVIKLLRPNIPCNGVQNK